MTPRATARFKKDLKRYRNDTGAIQSIREVILLACTHAALPVKYREHALSGKYSALSECHVRPDLLLIFERTGTELVLYRVGSHSELFA